MANQALNECPFSEGDALIIWKSTEDPRTDFLTRMASAAMVCGCDIVSDKGFHHVIESDERDNAPEPDPNAPPVRSVTWIWDGKKTATFRPNFKEETISLKEFEERFTSLEWCEANPDHPISYMRYFLERSRKTMEKVSLPPGLKVIRDDAVASCPPGATSEEIDEQFALLDDD